MLNRDACRCQSCRARDAREFERIVAGFTPTASPRRRGFSTAPWPETESLAARVAAYTYGERTK